MDSSKYYFRSDCPTYINSNSFMMVENGYFGVICRNVSVKLLLIEIPLDTKKKKNIIKS